MPKTHFHKKGCAVGLILKVRVFGTQKWSIPLLHVEKGHQRNRGVCTQAKKFYILLFCNFDIQCKIFPWYYSYFRMTLKWKRANKTENNKPTEIERFDWFIQRIQTRVVFDCQRTLGWKTFMPENFLEINRYFALTPYCNTVGQSNNAFPILGFSGGKTKRPCFDLFIHWLIKQITNTYQNHFSRSYENRSMQKWSLPYIFVLMPFCISMNFTNWNFFLENHSLLVLLFC